LFSENSLSNRLFQLDELTEFIRRMLGYETLYRSTCPTLSIQVNVMDEGDRFDWHFDTNDGVVSFMIQNADTGGAFEYVPLIRDEDDENYDTVSDVFDGSHEPRRQTASPGTLLLFLGRRSIHRVAPVGATKRSRLSLLYSYDRTPGMVFPIESCHRITSSSNEPYLGAQTKPG
jgi:predicted 2-oxoglutarate/Fe(II)-dependent dioxygenase YbiX